MVNGASLTSLALALNGLCTVRGAAPCTAMRSRRGGWPGHQPRTSRCWRSGRDRLPALAQVARHREVGALAVGGSRRVHIRFDTTPAPASRRRWGTPPERGVPKCCHDQRGRRPSPGSRRHEAAERSAASPRARRPPPACEQRDVTPGPAPCWCHRRSRCDRDLEHQHLVAVGSAT